jgi:hypothetical protein
MVGSKVVTVYQIRLTSVNAPLGRILKVDEIGKWRCDENVIEPVAVDVANATYVGQRSHRFGTGPRKDSPDEHDSRKLGLAHFG